jgi:hypothetical protein
MRFIIDKVKIQMKNCVGSGRSDLFKREKKLKPLSCREKGLGINLGIN